MDKIKKIDILQALSCLKAMCASYDTCVNCPAYKGLCKITYTDPEDYDLNIEGDYDLNIEGDYVWRAFND